jgi:hypothetical protein
MASSLDPKLVSSVLMQTTPPSIHDKHWPGYERGKTFFDYLEKYPHAQQNSIGWPGNLHSALVPGAKQLIPGVGNGLQVEGMGPDPMSLTPQQRPDFNRGRNFWNTVF